MYFIVSIDTEEDNWNGYREKPSLNNIKRLSIINDLSEIHDFKVTYFVTYPVSCDENSMQVLKSFKESNRCEIGTHLHPWNTPPFIETKNIKNTMLNNLNKEIQFQKLYNLHVKLAEKIWIEPVSFRAGRYAFDNNMARNLAKLKYSIDSSITPYIDWTDFYGPDFSNVPMSNPYYLSCKNFNDTNECASILEVPLTVGFTRKNYKVCSLILNTLNKRPYNKFKLIGILSKLNILEKIHLTPEINQINDMKSLIHTLLKNNIKLLNLSFHSSSLLEGCTPFVKTKKDFNDFVKKIENIILYMKSLGFKSINVSETKNLLMK